jgi:hypothetical protein
MTLFRDDDDEAVVVSLVTDRVVEGVVIPVDVGGRSSGVGDCGGISPCSVGIGCCGVAVVDSEAKEVEISVVGGISRGCCGIGCGAGGGVEVGSCVGFGCWGEGARSGVDVASAVRMDEVEGIG